MPYFHFAARSVWPLNPLSQRDVCADLWSRLSKRFDPCLACVLMPNHLHLALETTDPRGVQNQLSIELRALTRTHFPGQNIWERVPSPELIPDTLHLIRTIRYIHLNPNRKGLARDPLEWEWSTHRDAVGLVAEPWLDIASLQRLWRKNPRYFANDFHHYVSSDPTARVEGTRFLTPPGNSGFAAPLDKLAHAVSIATRLPTHTIQKRHSESRRILVHLAGRIGSFKGEELAALIGTTRRAVVDLRKSHLSQLEQAALSISIQILSDRRLTS